MKFLIEQNPFDNPKEALRDLELSVRNEFEEWCRLNPRQCINRVFSGSYFDYKKDKKGWKVRGSIYFNNMNLNYIPIKFYEVKENFSIAVNPSLKSLKNAPKIIGKNFYAEETALTSGEIGKYFKEAEIGGSID